MNRFESHRLVGGGGTDPQLEQLRSKNVSAQYKILLVIFRGIRRSCIGRSALLCRQIKSFLNREGVDKAPCKVPKTCYNSDMLLHNYNQKAGFTLAETLITLGIIGVVAAITMPTLINKIQDRQNIAKWKKEYSLISNAFQSVFNEGVAIFDSEHPGFVSDEFRNKMIEKLKVVDSCQGELVCDNYAHNNWNRVKYKWSGVSGTSSRYKALGGNGIKGYNFNQYSYLLNDGSAVYFGGSHGGPWVVVDVNNFTHGPNEFGRDVFVLKVYSNNKSNQHWIKPMGVDGTYNKTVNGDTCECSKDKGAKTGTYIAGGGGTGEVISGACCSAYYLYSK